MKNINTFGSLIASAILIITIGIIGYFIGAKKTSQEIPVSDIIFSPTSGPSTSPSLSSSPELTPTPLPSISIKFPTPTPISNPTTTPLVSSISGLVTLDGNPIASMEIKISDSNNNFIKTVITGTDGRFKVELSPGIYIVGPFKEPGSGAIVNSSRVTVDEGSSSEINITFKSQ